MGEIADAAKLLVELVYKPFRVLGGWLRRRRLAREDRERRIRFLIGLPEQLKAVVVEFHAKGAHTLRREPFDADVQQLTRMRVLTRGAGAGGYDAADSWMTLDTGLWSVLEEAIARDAALAALELAAQQQAYQYAIDDH